MFEALAQERASAVAGGVHDPVCQPSRADPAIAAGTAGSSRAIPKAWYTVPASTNTPMAEPQAAGIGYRTSNPRAMPAIDQPQIHKSSLPRDKSRRLGAPSIAPRINWSAISACTLIPHIGSSLPKPVPNGVEKVSLTLSEVTPMRTARPRTSEAASSPRMISPILFNGDRYGPP